MYNKIKAVLLTVFGIYILSPVDLRAGFADDIIAAVFLTIIYFGILIKEYIIDEEE